MRSKPRRLAEWQSMGSWVASRLYTVSALSLRRYSAKGLTKEIRNTHHQALDPCHLRARFLKLEFKVHHELYPHILILLQTIHYRYCRSPCNSVLIKDLIDLLFLSCRTFCDFSSFPPKSRISTRFPLSDASYLLFLNLIMLLLSNSSKIST